MLKWKVYMNYDRSVRMSYPCELTICKYVLRCGFFGVFLLQRFSYAVFPYWLIIKVLYTHVFSQHILNVICVLLFTLNISNICKRLILLHWYSSYIYTFLGQKLRIRLVMTKSVHLDHWSGWSIFRMYFSCILVTILIELSWIYLLPHYQFLLLL